MKKSLLILSLLFVSSIAKSDGLSPILGVHYDNSLGASVELGGLYWINRVETKPIGNEENLEPKFRHLNFAYLEGELGDKGESITAGVGRHYAMGSMRVGVSKMNLESDRLSGIEFVFAPLTMSAKFGIYQQESDSSIVYMAGFGFAMVSGW